MPAVHNLGPGDNAPGIGPFRHTKSFGTGYSHTGNLVGFTSLLSASGDGRRSVTVSVSAQPSPTIRLE